MKRLRGLLLGFFAFLISAFIVSTPVFADPDTTTTTPADTTVTTPAEGEGESTEAEATEPVSCSDQIGKLSWLVCPGTGLLANIIDGAYNILTYLIEIDPLPNDADSPFRMIWTYCRNITNILFVVVLLICIISQITGAGISNYGIKRMLPRIVVIVLLSNLSYFICQAAVDLSNILGNGLSGVFEMVQNQAIANGAINIEFIDVGVGAIISHFLGIGVATATAITVLANVGGFAGLIWLILPVVLSGVLAVVSAVLTMAARQSLIYLLVMISPLAIIAYALPNTEKWAQKWYSLFMRMLFFYPMFALMYSASRLAGLVIMSTATHATDSMEQSITLVIGIAVQLIPLFLSIPMMRMSGTFLSKISGIVSTISAPATRSFGNMALERRKHAIERQRFNTSVASPSAHLAQYLQQRKTDRINEIAEMERSNRQTYETRYKAGYFNDHGKLTNRGVMHYEIAARNVQADRIALEIDNEFDKGFDTDPRDGEISDRLTRGNYRKIAAANAVLADELVRKDIVTAQADKIRRDNINKRATEMRDLIRGDSDNVEKVNSIRSIINDAYQVKSAKEENAARQSVLSHAIAAKRKVDTEERAEKFELLSDYPAGNLINEALEQSFIDGDYTMAEAAIQVMTQRGDQNLITETIEKMTREGQHNILTRQLTEADGKAAYNEAMRFQKHILDSALPLKKENVILASWAKANMIRRAKHEAGQNVAAFVGVADYLNSRVIGDEDAEEAKKLGAKQIISEYANGDYFITQDRTTFKVIDDFRRAGIIDEGRDAADIFLEKTVRSGLASGKMDGELLGNALNLFTSDFYSIVDMKKIQDKSRSGETFTLDDVLKDVPVDDGTPEGAKRHRKFLEQVEFFKNNKQSATKWVYDQLVGMTPQQLAGQKSTAVKIYNAILGLFGHDGQYDEESNSGFDADGNSIELREFMKKRIAGIKSKKGNGSTLRNKMNPDVKKILGIPEEDELERQWETGQADPDADPDGEDDDGADE